MSAGVLGKLFKKKDEDLEDFPAFDKSMGAGVPGPAGYGGAGSYGGGYGGGMPSMDTGLPGVAPSMPSYGSDNQMIQKDIELITSRLDALKISIDTMLQRLANIEARLVQLQQPAQQQQPTVGQTFGFGAPPQQQQDTGWRF